jgi:phosphoglycolate phosphatase
MNPAPAAGHKAPPRALILDLDGTLLDTAPDFAWAGNAMRTDLGLPPLPIARFATFIGQGMAVFVRRALINDLSAAVAPDWHDQGMASFMTHYARMNGQGARLYSGVLEGLEQWQQFGWPLACVTNKPQALAEPLLRQFGLLDRFRVVLGGDALPHKKPHPAPMWQAASALGVPHDAVVALGDSRHDVAAARAAGMRVILVSYGYNEGEPLEALAADAIVDSLADAARHLLAMA